MPKTDKKAPSMEKRVIDTRLAVQRAEGKPNTLTGLEAWEYALVEYPELTDKDQSAFVREWYAGVHRSQKAEVAAGGSKSSASQKGRRKRGYDKNGQPTNAARATRMEEQVKVMWTALLEYAATKNKKVEKAVNAIHQAALVKAEEIRKQGEIEKAEKDAKRAARRAEKEATA